MNNNNFLTGEMFLHLKNGTANVSSQKGLELCEREKINS